MSILQALNTKGKTVVGELRNMSFGGCGGSKWGVWGRRKRKEPLTDGLEPLETNITLSNL